MWRTSGRAVAGGELRGHLARRGQRAAGPGEVSPDRKRAITYGTAATGVLRCGCRRAHLTRAAERLRIAEPAVSQQIRRWRPSLASGCCTATGARSPSRQLARRCCPMRALPSRRSSTAGKPWPRCAGWSPASSAALTTPTAVGRATWMGVGSRSGRYLDRDRVRVSAPGARRRGPRRAREALAGAVPPQHLAPPDRRRRLPGAGRHRGDHGRPRTQRIVHRPAPLRDAYLATTS